MVAASAPSANNEWPALIKNPRVNGLMGRWGVLNVTNSTAAGGICGAIAP